MAALIVILLHLDSAGELIALLHFKAGHKGGSKTGGQDDAVEVRA
jgi:hypothetical protein